ARATFSPALLVSDGEALLVANDLPVGSGDKLVEGWIPFRSVFDMVWSGRRHVMMGATQIDRHGNQNISVLGEHAKPKVQLIGVRGAPGNTINHSTSYWVQSHTPRTFVEHVDLVGGVGTDRGAADLRRVVTNLCVFDFETPDGAMRLRSVHPGVTVDEVLANTGFAPAIAADVEETRVPAAGELTLIREVLDPGDLRKTEVVP
ncbi:MAG: CoA-transferase, partial [Chloroflexi bacterium]|nr:CoA-transferase [Chloroflexota bacterium]